MFRIGEFSKLTQVSIRMLRYYDETGLLKPAETDPWTGYRMYSVEQIPTLNRIRYLRDSGFQVSEIAQILDKKDDSLLMKKFDEKYSEIQENIQREQERLKKIELAKSELDKGQTDMHYNITVRSIPAYQVLALRRVIPDYYSEGELWQELCAFASLHRVNVSNDTFSIYYDAEYKETDVDVELCAIVQEPGRSMDGFTYRTIEAVPNMACTMVYGAFSNIAEAYIAFAQWIEKNSHYQMSGPTRQIVHRGPWNETEPEKYLIELQIPLMVL